jgi:hypothetical protein
MRTPLSNAGRIGQRLIEGESFDIAMDGDHDGGRDIASLLGDDSGESEEDLDEVDNALRESTCSSTAPLEWQDINFHIPVLVVLLLISFSFLALYANELAFTLTSVISSWPWGMHLSHSTEHREIISRFERLEAQILGASRDWVGMQDFALRYNGGRVVDNLTTQITMQSGERRAYGATVAVDDDVRPGQCWRVDGSSAQLGIRLRHAVQVTNITVDHISKKLVTSTQNAPRSMIVWGQPATMMDSDDSNKIWETLMVEGLHRKALRALSTRRSPIINNDLQFLPLAFLEYDVHSHWHIQTFSVFDTTLKMNASFATVVFEILDNWGGSSTCLYRVRVHGNERVEVKDG